MQLRKLDKSEHRQTRQLWETVFTDDSRQFLDYYYFIKTRENEIYVIEEEEQIRSMIQLNPYLIQIEEVRHRCHYIIAVATEANYRKRGYMGELLRKTMHDMYTEKEPFTFLMPAAESIYTPYDFRFVYDQSQSHITNNSDLAQTKSSNHGADELLKKVQMVEATMSDSHRLKEFFEEKMAPKKQVYAYRDEEYYHTMLMEQQSENGGIKLLLYNEKLVGYFPYAREGDKLEVREPILDDNLEIIFEKLILAMQADQSKPVLVKGYDTSKTKEFVPCIMVRLLHVETFLKTLKVKNGEKIHCSFAVIDPIIPKNNRVWKLFCEDSGEIQVRETEDSEGVLTVGALTSILFGYKNISEIKMEPNVYISGRLEEELEKIQTLKTVFLNEIV